MGNGKMKNRKIKPTLNPSPISNFIFQFSVLFPSFIFPFPALVTSHGKHFVEQGNLTHLSWPPKYSIPWPHIVAKIIKIILESLYHFAVLHAGQVYNCNKTGHSSSACTCRFLSSLCERKRKKTGNETSRIVQLGGCG